jgi:hypothetical protein
MTKNSISGRASITLAPITMAPAGPPHTYMGVAQGMLPGVQALAATPVASSLALALVAAHMLECLLKAFLSRGGSDAAVTKTKVRHNLALLWSMAAQEGLAVPIPAPSWVTRLSEVHNSPYYLRYSTGIHGIVLPAAQPMADELAALADLVRKSLI